MAEINIVDLIWDSFNEMHIWERHRHSRAEVEAVCYSEAEHLYVEATYGGRYLVLGPGSEGKLFVVVLAPKVQEYSTLLVLEEPVQKSVVPIENGKQVNKNERSNVI